MSAPRTKRQFAGVSSDPAQRQITSFFSIDSTSRAGAEATPSSRPVLPADTQSNLLNVGMRVRKSVPEGYKTGSYTAMGLFKGPNNAGGNTATSTTLPAPVRAPSYANQRELLPFCGINKIGGLDSQPSFTFESPSPPSRTFRLGSVPSIDDIPSLSSSQDSVASNSSALAINIDLKAAARKRVYDEGDESDTPSISECLQIPSGEWMDGQVSPRSLVPVGWENTRVMAVPRKMRRSLKAGALPTVAISGVDERVLNELGQENMALDDDFPEADFLVYQALEDDAMDL